MMDPLADGPATTTRCLAELVPEGCSGFQRTCTSSNPFHTLRRPSSVASGAANVDTVKLPSGGRTTAR